MTFYILEIDESGKQTKLTPRYVSVRDAILIMRLIREANLDRKYFVGEE